MGVKGEQRDLFETALGRAMAMPGHRRLRIQVGEALLGSEIDLAKLQAARQEIIALVDDRLEAMRQAAMVLSPDQRLKLAEHMNSR